MLNITKIINDYYDEIFCSCEYFGLRIYKKFFEKLKISLVI